jgi:inhibitor of cysteine peptidase
MRRNGWQNVLGGALLAAALLVACVVPTDGEMPTPPATPPDGLDRPTSDATPSPSPTPEEEEPGEVIVGVADVESVELLIMESFPVQVTAVVRGNLRDGCTRIGTIDQEVLADERRIAVQIGTVRPADAFCTQALVPYEERVPLEVRGLPAGEYTVDVNGLTATFTLAVDNVLAPGDDY